MDVGNSLNPAIDIGVANRGRDMEMRMGTQWNHFHVDEFTGGYMKLGF